MEMASLICLIKINKKKNNMDKIEIIRVVVEVVAGLAIWFLSTKSFKYKAVLEEIIKAAKDLKITEAEFQAIVDKAKAEVFPKEEI